MTQKTEFSRTIAVEGIIPDKVREETIEATPQECADLAVRFGIREITSFKAKLSIRRVAGGDTVRVAGEYVADVVQACVVTLRDVPEHMTGQFETFFSENAPEYNDEEMDFAFDDDESTPEQISNGIIDLGEVTAQYLALDLNPYPRAPGVSLAAQMAENGVEIKAGNPFQAALEGLADTDSAKKK